MINFFTIAVMGSCWGQPVYCRPMRPVYYVAQHRVRHDVHAHARVRVDPIETNVNIAPIEANVNIAPIDVNANVNVTSEPLEIVVRRAPHPIPAPVQPMQPFIYPWYILLPWLLLFTILGACLFAWLCRLMCGKVSSQHVHAVECNSGCSCGCGHKPKKPIKVWCCFKTC